MPLAVYLLGINLLDTQQSSADAHILDVYSYCTYTQPLPKVQLLGYRYERCGHEWLPRDKEHNPKVCPKCKAPYWDRPRQSDGHPRKPKPHQR